MARAIWKGHVSFGLVQIPVELHTAVRDQDLSFDLLDRRDMARVGYKRVNKRTGKEVPSEDIVKGYAIEPGHYVIVEDEDFARANVEATKSIEIVAFVDGARIDPRAMVKPYYVVPASKNPKAYALLRAVLEESGKVGIARVVLRSRQYVGAVLVRDGVLVLELLRYAAEVLDPGVYSVPGGDLEELGVTEKELRMARLLVDGMESEWEPEAWHDEYRHDLLAAIEEKAKTGKIEVVAEERGEEESGKVVDIMELLKRSVASAPKQKKQRAAR